MEDKKEPGEKASEDLTNAGRNRNPDNKMDIDPTMGGPFTYSDNQENESVHTVPDDSLNLASRDAEGWGKNDSKARDNSGNKDRQR
jgi:hypothetical protein